MSFPTTPLLLTTGCKVIKSEVRGVCSYRPHPRLARALDIMFTLHAEHEMNCSTAAARHLASSGVDVYTAIAGALDQDLCF